MRCNYTLAELHIFEYSNARDQFIAYIRRPALLVTWVCIREFLMIKSELPESRLLPSTAVDI